MRFIDALIGLLVLYVIYYGVVILYDVFVKKNIGKNTGNEDGFEVYGAPQSHPIKPKMDDYLPSEDDQKKNW